MFKSRDKAIVERIIDESKEGPISELATHILVRALEDHYIPMEREVDAMVRECCAGTLKKEIKSLIEEGQDTKDYAQTMYVNDTTDTVLRRMLNSISDPGDEVAPGESYTVIGIPIRTECEGKAIEGWPVMETAHKNGDPLV